MTRTWRWRRQELIMERCGAGAWMFRLRCASLNMTRTWRWRRKELILERCGASCLDPSAALGMTEEKKWDERREKKGMTEKKKRMKEEKKENDGREKKDNERRAL